MAKRILQRLQVAVRVSEWDGPVVNTALCTDAYVLSPAKIEYCNWDNHSWQLVTQVSVDKTCMHRLSA